MSRWTRRRFAVALAGAPAALLVAACRPRASEAPAQDEDPFAALEPGQGAVLRVEGQAVAAYRGKDGELLALSPRCPHQGCEVAWNASDRTWDCPCHGSLFEADGTLLEGPATRDMDPT